MRPSCPAHLRLPNFSLPPARPELALLLPYLMLQDCCPHRSSIRSSILPRTSSRGLQLRLPHLAGAQAAADPPGLLLPQACCPLRWHWCVPAAGKSGVFAGRWWPEAESKWAPVAIGCHERLQTGRPCGDMSGGSVSRHHQWRDRTASVHGAARGSERRGAPECSCCCRQGMCSAWVASCSLLRHSRR